MKRPLERGVVVTPETWQERQAFLQAAYADRQHKVWQAEAALEQAKTGLAEVHGALQGWKWMRERVDAGVKGALTREAEARAKRALAAAGPCDTPGCTKKLGHKDPCAGTCAKQPGCAEIAGHTGPCAPPNPEKRAPRPRRRRKR